MDERSLFNDVYGFNFSNQNALQIPDYWERLNDIDKEKYLMMREQLSSRSNKYRRNKSNETFATIIENIKSFVIQGDENDYNRGLVCGLIFLNEMFQDCLLENSKGLENEDLNSLDKEYVAINTKQLRILLDKCKSSINGSFHQIGYEIIEDYDTCQIFASLYEPNQLSNAQQNQEKEKDTEKDKDNAKMFAIISKLFPEFGNKYKFIRQWAIRERKFSYKVTSKRRKPISFLKQKEKQLRNKKLQSKKQQQPKIEKQIKRDENVFETFSEPITKAEEPTICNENIVFDSIFGNDSLDFIDYFTF